MPRIPASQIPNAPGGAAPVMRGGNRRMPGRVATDVSGAALDPSGIGRAQSLLGAGASNLSRAASSVARSVDGVAGRMRDAAPRTQDRSAQVNLAVQTELAKGADAALAAQPIAGLSEIAAGFGAASNAMAIFADAKMREKEMTDLAAASILMNEAYAAHKLQIESGEIPESEWVSRWTGDMLPKVQEAIKGMKPSGRIAGRLQADLTRFASESSLDFAAKASRRGSEIAISTLGNAVEMAAMNGDLEAAEGLLMEGVQTGVLRQDQADQQWMKIETAKRKENANAAMMSDPQTFAEMMQRGAETGKAPEGFDYMQTEEMTQWARAARSESRVRQSETFEGIVQQIDAGQISTPEEIEMAATAAGGALDPTQIVSLKSSLNAPEAANPEVYSQIYSQVTAYDPSKDPEGKGYVDLMNQVTTQLPRAVQGEFRSKLYRVRSGFEKKGTRVPVSDQIKSIAFKQIDMLLGSSQESRWKREDGTADDAGRIAAAEREMELKQAFDMHEWKNPNDPKEVTQWLREQMRDDTIGTGSDMLKEEKKPWWNFFGSNASDATEDQTTMPDGIVMNEESSQSPPSFLGQSGPAAIRYNNPGAMYPGPSAKKFGSTETKTIGGGHKIAVFPDAVSGAAAQFDLLDRVYTGKTLASAIRKWSGGNSVSTYLKVIEKEAGLSGDTLLTEEMMRDPAVAIPLVKAMARQESGRDYPIGDQDWQRAHQMAFGS
jgi:hypothetical protein